MLVRLGAALVLRPWSDRRGAIEIAELDIEIVREEEVKELLHDVRIIERKMDPVSGICTSVAAMPKSRILAPDKSETR